MSLLEAIKTNLEALKGADVHIFGQSTKLSSDNGISVDAIEVIDHLKQFEINEDYLYKMGYNLDEDFEGDLVECFDTYLSDNCEEINSDNSYNWSSVISHDFYIHKYKELNDDTYIYKIAFHRYGDVRANYTNEAYLLFDDEDAFLYELMEVQSYISIEVGGKDFSCNASTVDNCFQCYNEELGDFEAWGSDEDELTEDLKIKIEGA